MFFFHTEELCECLGALLPWSPTKEKPDTDFFKLLNMYDVFPFLYFLFYLSFNPLDTSYKKKYVVACKQKYSVWTVL